jgi:predicted nucleic acid-binding protein
MASKVFLDANILLDFTLKRDGYSVSKKIVELVVNGRIQAYITPSIVHIMGYWLTKAYGKATAKELILSLLINIRVIDTNHETTLNALHSKMDDIEDALQYFTAMHHNVDFFITKDKLLRKIATPVLPVYLPEEFLKEYK